MRAAASVTPGLAPSLRERLKRRPDTEHEMMLNRLVISALALIYLSASSWLGAEDAQEVLRNCIVLVAGYLVLSAGLMAHILAHPGVSHPRRCVALVLDMTVLSLGMHFGNSAFALGYPLYLWIIFGNGFRFGVKYLAGSAVAALTGFALVTATTPFWRQELDVAIGLAVGLVLLPAYVAALIRKLSEAKRQAEEGNRAKSQFLTSVSHELRTPLNAVIMLSDLLAQGQREREQREMAETIGASGRSLLKLINNILDLSRMEAGKHVRRLGDFDVPGTFAQVRRTLAVQASAKGLALTLRIDRKVPALGHGSAQELEEIVMNLVGNAIKFTETGHVAMVVEAQSRGEGGHLLKVEVSDTGIGIDADAQGRIFQSFVQADASIIDRFGGTGLGLSIVKQLVEANGGTISVVSTPGHGSTFSFTFAVQPAVGQPTPAPALAAQTGHAFVVSRNLALEPQLALQGWRVTRLATPAEAVAAVRAQPRNDMRPIVLFDLDTLGAGERSTISELGNGPLADAVAGFATAWPLPAADYPLLPLAFVTACPPSDADLARLLQFARASAATDASATSRPLRSLAILVAEDNVTNQKVIAKLLEREGHKPTIVENGEQAVDAMLKGSFDLALMDINMPVMNGIEATKLYRFAALGRAHLPIYALTADVTPETERACAAAGMDGCLHKPIEQSVLRTLLMSLAGADAGNGDSGSSAETPAPSAADSPLAPDEIALLDEGTLRNLLALGEADFVAGLIAQFLPDARRQIEELDQARAAGDAPAFRNSLHSLRSAAANVGARRLFALCLDWREASQDQLSSQGEAWMATLRATLEASEPAFAAWLVENGSPALRRA